MAKNHDTTARSYKTRQNLRDGAETIQISRKNAARLRRFAPLYGLQTEEQLADFALNALLNQLEAGLEELLTRHPITAG